MVLRVMSLTMCCVGLARLGFLDNPQSNKRMRYFRGREGGVLERTRYSIPTSAVISTMV